MDLNPTKRWHRDIKECQKYLADAIEEIDLTKTDNSIIGDLNVDILDKMDKNVKKIVTTLKQKGLLQQIKDPTCITKMTATCIDLCFTNSNIVAGDKVCDVSLSDHELILVTLKKESNIKAKGTFWGQGY